MKQTKFYALMPILFLAIILTTTAACKRGSPSSPTITMKAYFEAIRKKDAEGFKKTLSKGSLETLENSAKQKSTTLDAAIKAGLNDPALAANAASTPEMRNEKINGDAATLEVKNDQTNSWESIPFVKENNEWKIALDQAMREAQQSSGPQ
ncbi:MAG TPA: hypothetical protein VGB17_08295 [Pyrinomonadaceae bacterium]|jgi:uncharacterized membrane protein